MTKKKKIILAVLIIFLLAVFAGAYYIYNIINTMSTPIETEKLGVNSNLDNKIINIAFFGIDGRDDEEVEGDRSDVIMIGTLDTKTNSLKLTSVMRDTFVKICKDTGEDIDLNKIYAGDNDGIEWDIVEDTGDGTEERVTVDYDNQRGVAEYNKINAAFNESGVESSILTLNTNFDLNIEDYVTVDFTCLIEVIDALGGIEVNITNEELLYWTNQFLMESNYYGHRNDPDLTQLGPQTVTGAQALAFVRVRYSDSDYGRSQRQREVVQAIFDKIKTMDPVTALGIINKVYPYVKTSLSLSEITSYATTILNTKEITFESYRIPGNEDGTSGFINEIWYLFPDTLIENNRMLHEFIYNDTYIPSGTVKQISQVISDAINYEATGLTYDVGGKEEEKMEQQKVITEENGETVETPDEEVEISP